MINILNDSISVSETANFSVAKFTQIRVIPYFKYRKLNNCTLIKSLLFKSTFPNSLAKQQIIFNEITLSQKWFGTL